MSKAVLVCGGRDFCIPQNREKYALAQAKKEQNFLIKVLDSLLLEIGSFTLVHGTARGADSFAASWAEWKKLPIKAYPADWKRYNRAAGSIRNQQMLDKESPDLVIAFCGGTGTAHMVSIARAANIPVTHYENV